MALVKSIAGNEICDQTARNDISRLNIGGRNLVRNSDVYITGTNDRQFSFSFDSDLSQIQGKTITLSLDIDLDKAVGNRVGFEPSFNYSDGTNDWFGLWFDISSATTVKKRIYITYTIPNKTIVSLGQRGIYIQGVISGTAKIGRPKLEIGNKPTDWTPALEDALTMTDDNNGNVTIKM